MLSVSSAQLEPGVISDAEAVDGVAVPETPVLDTFADGVEAERPFAACAYEKPPELDSATFPPFAEAILPESAIERVYSNVRLIAAGPDRGRSET